jgi:hypothetical protein
MPVECPTIGGTDERDGLTFETGYMDAAFGGPVGVCSRAVYHMLDPGGFRCIKDRDIQIVNVWSRQTLIIGLKRLDD